MCKYAGVGVHSSGDGPGGFLSLFWLDLIIITALDTVKNTLVNVYVTVIVLYFKGRVGDPV